MSLEERFIKRNGELQQKVKEEIEKVKEGQSERNIVQLQTILTELQKSNMQKNVILSYKRAYAAQQMAQQFDCPLMSFDEMGVYQLLFLIEDHQVLEDMYHQLLNPLLAYDYQHHGELEKTLYYYLVYDGSQQAMAKHLYMHRNTINYRLTKIKELLSCELSTFEEKQQLVDLVKERMADDNTGVQVYIGDELPISTMKDCSVVTATYELGEGMHGTIGIVGPKRMDYENVVNSLKTLKVELDEVFKKNKSNQDS